MLPNTAPNQKSKILTLKGAVQIETAQRALQAAGLNRSLQIKLCGVLSECEDYTRDVTYDNDAPASAVSYTCHLEAPDGVQARQDVLAGLERAQAAKEANPELAIAAESLLGILTAQ